MRRALISMRQNKNEHGSWIDTLESSYAEFFSSIGVELLPLLNLRTDREELRKKVVNVDFIVLSGSGDIDNDQDLRDELERNLILIARELDKPVIGICRGAQIIAVHYGFQLKESKSDFRVNGNSHLIFFRGMRYSVNHYHNYIIINNFKESITSKFEIGTDADFGNVEIIISHSDKILGFQWHPERIENDNEALKLAKKLISEVLFDGINA